MATFAEFLNHNADAITGRWLAAALATYPDEAARVFAREQDPFANPVGHALRRGVEQLFSAICDGAEADEIRRPLHDMLSIRAVQDFPASGALGFIFALKQAVRQEAARAGVRGWDREVAAFEDRVDRVALTAFDVFVQCRERLAELRINEVKRQVSWVVGKVNARAAAGQPPGVGGPPPWPADSQEGPQ